MSAKDSLRHGLTFGVAAAALVYDPLAPAAASKRVAALLVALVALAVVLGRWVSRPVEKRKLELGWAATMWIAFTVWSAVSVVWGKPVGLDVAATWVAGAALIVVAGGLRPGEARSVAMASGWMVGTTTAVVVLAQWVTGLRGVAVHGGQGNANWAGLLLAVTIPLSAGLVVEGRKRGAWWWAAALAGVGFQLPALGLSGSRVAWVAVVAAAVVAVGSGRRQRQLAKGATLLVVLAALAGASESRADEAEPTPAIAQAEGSLAGRVWIWRASLNAAKEALPWGTGLGGFGHAYLEAQGDNLRVLSTPQASRRFHNATTAHQDWIQALVETGSLGLLLLAASLALAWLGHARERAWPATAAVTSVMVCAMGDSPLRQPAIVCLVALVIGAEPVRKRMRLPVVAAGLLACSLSLALSVGAWLAARLETQARDTLPDERIRLLERAVSLDGRSGQARLSMGLAMVELGDGRGAVASLEASRERLANVGTEVALGNAWMLEGEAAKAERCYRRALQLHPGSFRGHANLAEALREQGKLDEAQKQLDEAKRLYPGHPKLAVMQERLDRAKREREVE